MTMKSLFMFCVVFLLVLWSAIHSNHALELVHDDEGGAIQGRALIPELNYTVTPNIRKLLLVPDFGDGDGTGNDGNNRIWGGSCSEESIHVNQGATDPLPGSGIPTYTVIVENLCYTESCSISNIHLHCGWFSSARLINPKIFRRLRYDDCLVNNGQPLTPGQSLTFVYANTYKYPLSVASLKC